MSAKRISAILAQGAGKVCPNTQRESKSSIFLPFPPFSSVLAPLGLGSNGGSETMAKVAMKGMGV